MNAGSQNAATVRDRLRAQLKDLDTLLGDVGPSDARKALVQTRTSMQAQLNAIVYPVLTLPPEVVSEIFIRTLSETRARPNVTEAPLLLCTVCSQWRTIAIFTPALWSSIELTFKFSLFGSNFLALLDLWLSRTGHHPLSLSLYYDEYTVTKNRPQVDLVVHLLLRHSHQWADVELKLPDASGFHQFKGYHYPALKALSLTHSVNTSIPPVASFTNAPSLTSVQLSAGSAADPIVLPWPQLTSLKCEALYVHDCLGLLRETTQLVEFTVYLQEGGAEIQHLPFLILPTLRSLHLLREECHMDLLQYLTLPALETLSISFENHGIPRFFAFLSRSACPLHRVIFDAWPFDQAELVKCLAAMPSLQHLKLWRPQYFTDSLLLQLADPAVLLPNLKSLELNHVYPIQFTMPALVGMLSARSNAPVRLQSFQTVLHKASMVTDPVSEICLQALVASGMKIQINYH
ncbi:hypothetical protein C8F04DRAFT_228474 [Mycena alexandri]|uniref:F-box domain-containing protein n=1 Tax=Mycena alexandri TaxID=1745969 RepID=A0AAD6T7W8_9AGAR|nr:hypothetical protein C8F04DRAFT_228474 [Mycena alexandri]